MYKPPHNLVGPAVRRLRSEKKLTQERFAARCNVMGWDLSRGTLAKIEAGVRRVSDLEAMLLATALKVHIRQLYPERLPAWALSTKLHE